MRNMQVKIITATDGNGYWSECKKNNIIIHKLSLFPDEFQGRIYGELRAYFTGWNINRDGLIYTDDKWMRTFIRGLKDIGLVPYTRTTVTINGEEHRTQPSYSEQGMQGDRYVSMDVEEPFIRKWFDIQNQININERGIVNIINKNNKTVYSELTDTTL